MRPRDLVDPHLVASALYYEWSADAQKLYFWLRQHVCRGEDGAPPQARHWHAQGYLCVYAPADLLMSRALPVSKNTLTKIVGELRARGILETRFAGRGTVYLLGEWLRRPSPLTGADLYFEAFYLDPLLAT